MDVLRMRVGMLLRRGWRATLFLAVLAGLAAGMAMAAFSIGRKASSAFDRFIAFSDPSDLLINFCPPELETIDEESLPLCFAYDAADEGAVARQLPEIEAAGRVAFVGLTASLPADPNRTWPANALLNIDAEPSADGAPIVVAGRRPDPAAPDEVALSERFAEITGVELGDEIDLTFWSREEMGTTVDEGESFSGPRVRARVVGTERNFRDLVSHEDTSSSAFDEARLSAGPGLAATITEAGRFTGLAIAATDGDAAAAEAAIDEAFAGRLYNTGPQLDADDTDPVAEAIRFEAGGTMLFGAITALAAVAFAGQAVSRQSRREWADGPTLRALGMANRDAASAAALRGAATGAIAAALAIASAIAFSTLGPFGVAGLVEVDAGAVVDGPVLVLGGVLVLVVVAGATAWPVVRQFRRSAHRPSFARRAGLGAVQGHLPAPAAAGLSMSLSGRGAGGLPTGTALAGVALAFTTALAAVGLTTSLDALTSQPAQFGAPWDLSADPGVGNPDELAAIANLVRNDPDVQAAAGIVGTDATIGDQVAWFQAFAPLDGVDQLVGPVITSGRAPAAIDEVALGSTTMADQGLSLGDSIELRPTTSTNATSRVTVVGTTIINDSFENNPGRGGVVTVDWIDQYAGETSPDPVVIRLRPGADADRLRAELEDVASAGVNGPVRQGAIRNVERVRFIPFLIAALVGVLAVASLAHALVLSVRRQRSQLAILKSLGFRRGQVRAAVAWHASLLVLVAAVIGVPLGVIVGRWGWRLVADELGVASPPATPILWLAAIVVGVVVVANLVAAYPAWRAAREPTARALRVE